jgi:hypothetical protein
VAQFPAILSATARTAEQVAIEVEQQLQIFPQALVQVRRTCCGPCRLRVQRLILTPPWSSLLAPADPDNLRSPGMP